MNIGDTHPNPSEEMATNEANQKQLSGASDQINNLLKDLSESSVNKKGSTLRKGSQDTTAKATEKPLERRNSTGNITPSVTEKQKKMDEITAKNLKAISAELKKPAEPAHKFTITHKKEIEVSPVPPTTNIAHHAAANNFLLPAKPNNHQILTAAPQSIRPIRVGSTAVNVKSARPMVMSTYFAPQFQNAAKPSNFESSNLSLEVIPPVMDVHGGIQYENARNPPNTFPAG